MSDLATNISSQPIQADIPLWQKIGGALLLLAAIAIPIIVVLTGKKRKPPGPPTPTPTPPPYSCKPGVGQKGTCTPDANGRFKNAADCQKYCGDSRNNSSWKCSSGSTYAVYEDKTLTDVQKNVLIKGKGVTDPKNYACISGCTGTGECSVLSKDNKLWDVDGVPYTCLTVGHVVPEYQKNFCDTYSYNESNPTDKCEKCVLEQNCPSVVGQRATNTQWRCCNVQGEDDIQVPTSCTYSPYSTINENAGVY